MEVLRLSRYRRRAGANRLLKLVTELRLAVCAHKGNFVHEVREALLCLADFVSNAVLVGQGDQEQHHQVDLRDLVVLRRAPDA